MDFPRKHRQVRKTFIDIYNHIKFDEDQIRENKIVRRRVKETVRK